MGVVHNACLFDLDSGATDRRAQLRQTPRSLKFTSSLVEPADVRRERRRSGAESTTDLSVDTLTASDLVEA